VLVNLHKTHEPISDVLIGLYLSGKVGSHYNVEFWRTKLLGGNSICLSSKHAKNHHCDSLSSSILFQTSGSSGYPKWVIHNKDAVRKHARRVNAHLGVTGDDIFGLFLPHYHVGGFGVIVRAIEADAGLVVFDGKWNALGCCDFIRENQISVLSLVPTQIADVVDHHLKCPQSVRAVVVGGGKLEESLRQKAESLGWPILESYGMTETGSQIATGNLGDKGYLHLIDGWEVRVTGEGILEIRGDCLFDAYLMETNNGIEFIDVKKDGWFRTSDRVQLLEEGGQIGIKFLGRSDRVVKILGELVDVSSLEVKLKESVDGEVYLMSLPDMRRGMKLYPVVSKECLVEEVDGLGWRGLHRLEKALVVSHFPKNEMGKLKRRELEQMVESIVFSLD